eukprot:scaffold215631_cov39-Tisochrysis_lutea.AAC.3
MEEYRCVVPSTPSDLSCARVALVEVAQAHAELRARFKVTRPPIQAWILWVVHTDWMAHDSQQLVEGVACGRVAGDKDASSSHAFRRRLGPELVKRARGTQGTRVPLV